MSKSSVLLGVLVLLTIVVVILLTSGSSFLTVSLDTENQVPAGTFITWFGMITLPLSVFLGCGKLRNSETVFQNFLSVIIKMVIILGVLWLPFSYLLAGNIAFNFTEKLTFQGGQLAMKLFWINSYGIPALAMGVLVACLILALINEIRVKRS